jgi:hypothetical protein
MDDLEKDLKDLQFAEPPKWLRARVVVATQTVCARQNRVRRIKTLIVMAVAAGLILATLGHYILSALAPFTGGAPSPVKASPIEPLGGMGSDLFENSGNAAGLGTAEPAPAPASTETPPANSDQAPDADGSH